MTVSPTPEQLWRQAGGGTPAYSRDRYRDLMIEHGLLIPLAAGETPEPLPCGWPGPRRELCCDMHGHECAEPDHELCCQECPEWDNHCQHRAPTYDEDDDLHDPAEDYCVHCECCCTCLGCEYGPRDGSIAAESATPEQAAVLAELRGESG